MHTGLLQVCTPSKYLYGRSCCATSRSFSQEEGQEHLHDESVTSVGIELEGSLDMDGVNVWLSTLLREQGVDLFRSKGVLAIEGSDDRYASLVCPPKCMPRPSADAADAPACVSWFGCILLCACLVHTEHWLHVQSNHSQCPQLVSLHDSNVTEPCTKCS